LESHESNELRVSIVHYVESAEAVKDLVFESTLSDAEQAHQAKDFVPAILLGHLVFEDALDRLEVFTQDDCLLKAVAMLVVQLLHLVVNMERQVNMMSQHIFALCNIHRLQLGYVLLKFVDGLWCIFLFDYVLDVATLLTEGLLKRVEMFVAHIFEDLVFLISQRDYRYWVVFDLWILLGIGFNDVCVHGYRTRLYPEKLIQQALIGLVHAKRTHQVDLAVNHN
jgi:hypothetical protein